MGTSIIPTTTTPVNDSSAPVVHPKNCVPEPATYQQDVRAICEAPRMKKQITACDRCDAEIRDKRVATQLRVGYGGRAPKGSPLDLCPDCSKGLSVYLSGRTAPA